MRRIILTITVSYMLIAPTFIFGQAGQSGLTFLQLGVGGRSLAMGEAYSAIASDPSATYYNPAALSTSDDPQILLMHKEWIQDAKTEFIGVSTPLGPFAIGVSINSTNVDDIELRSIPGPAIGTFSSHDAAIGFSAAYNIDQSLSIGATAKYLYEKIYVDETTGAGFDIGALYKTPWSVQFAAAVSNLGSMNVYQTEAPVLPRLVRVGGAYETYIQNLDATLTLATDVVTVTEENQSHVNLGAEFEYRHSFAVRAGYQTGYEARSFSTGIGVHYGLFCVDYAFVPFRYDLGTTHTLSLNIDFH